MAWIGSVRASAPPTVIFRLLRLAGSIESSWHPVVAIGLDEILARTAVDSFADFLPIPRSVWTRFYVKGSGIPVAAADLSMSQPPHRNFEFLALREGGLIEETLRTLNRASEWSSSSAHYYDVMFLEVPGLHVSFLSLLGDPFAEWLFPLSPSLTDIPALEPILLPNAFSILRSQAERAMDNVFLRQMNREEPPEANPPTAQA